MEPAEKKTSQPQNEDANFDSFLVIGHRFDLDKRYRAKHSIGKTEK